MSDRMTRPAHTALPWVVAERGLNISIWRIDPVHGQLAYWGKIAQMSATAESPYAPIARANAALIVRAVNCHDELVKALELAEMHLAEAFRNTNYDPDPYETDESKTVLGRVRAAIARAKEQP